MSEHEPENASGAPARVRLVGAFDDPHAADRAEAALGEAGFRRSDVTENDEQDVELVVDLEEDRHRDSAERPLDVSVAVDDLTPADRDEVERLMRANGAEQISIEPERPG